jgi:hypothetical protein
MKQFIIVGAMLVISCDLFSQSNLILNSSFELEDNYSSVFYQPSPLTEAAVDDFIYYEMFFDQSGKCKSNKVMQAGLQSWSSDMKIVKKWGNSNCATYYLHSPDWYYFDLSTSKNRVYDNTTLQYVSGNTGQGYIGMKGGELIQQKFGTMGYLENSQKYTMRPLQN